ncbi:MAG: nucleotidyltransferase family protein [Elusimicrobia bacterium]|nr:nucleotidyltransferase family protein [Elusimicrobiota bacterium]
MTKLEMLRSRRDAILTLAANRGMKNVRVFGSVARGDDRPDSDIDFLVDVEPGRSLLDLAGWVVDLEENLHTKVDVVTARSVSPYMRTAVLKEAVLL